MHKKHHWKYSLTGINEFNHRYMNQKHLTIHIYLQISICYAIHYTNKIGMKYIPLAKGKKLTAKQYKKTYFESISIVIMPMILNSAQERHTYFGIINFKYEINKLDAECCLFVESKLYRGVKKLE